MSGLLTATRLAFANKTAGRFRFVCVVVGVILITWITCINHNSFDRVPANVTFSGLTAIMLAAIIYSYQNPSVMRKGKGRSSTMTKWTSTKLKVVSFSGLFFVALVNFYALGMPMLGIIDVGACTMFSHIKLHGGSNHYISPTGK